MPDIRRWSRAEAVKDPDHLLVKTYFSALDPTRALACIERIHAARDSIEPARAGTITTTLVECREMSEAEALSVARALAIRHGVPAIYHDKSQVDEDGDRA